MRRALVVGVFCLTVPVAAQLPMEWREPSTPKEQAVLAAQPEYQRFLQAASGQWRADFDPVLLTPRQILGSGVPLVAADADRNRVETAVLRFLDEHAALFGGERGDFVIDGAVFNRDLWSVVAKQQHRGIPVQGSHVSLAIKHGRLILVQGVSHRVSGVEETPRVRKDEAVGTAVRKHGLGNRRAGRMKDADAARAVILPQRSPGAVQYRLAWEVTSRREGDETATERNLVSYIDALNGEVLASYDANRYTYSGTASIELEQRSVGDPLVTVPAGFLDLNIAGTALRTDATGGFSLAAAGGPQGLTSQLRGAFVVVRNAANGNRTPTLSAVINDNTPLSLLWSGANSDPSERMAYRTVNETNRFVAPVFPGLEFLDFPIEANVNLSDICNAFSTGDSLNFFRAGGPCNATGRIFDVVAHEWGHSLDLFAPGGFQDGGLSEFIGDLVAFTQTDDSRIAPGFFVGGTHLRDMDNSRFECFDPQVSEVHDAGEMLGTVVWDVREDLKAAGMSADDLRRLMLLPIALAQTPSQWYAGMLAVDDNDGNLMNGTPNECLMLRQFRLHSCAGEPWPGLPATAVSVTASPAVLWPANHKMVPITIDAVASSQCQSVSGCRVVSVESNEPIDGLGDGDAAPDWIIDGSTVQLRAERSGRGTGRIYTLHVECMDASGNTVTSVVVIAVPRDQR